VETGILKAIRETEEAALHSIEDAKKEAHLKVSAAAKRAKEAEARFLQEARAELERYRSHRIESYKDEARRALAAAQKEVELFEEKARSIRGAAKAEVLNLLKEELCL